MLQSGTESFRRKCKTTKSRFDTKIKYALPIEFTGFNVERCSNERLTLDQKKYLRKLEELQDDANFSQFRSMRMKLGWLTNTRPDVLFEIAILAQVTDAQFKASKRDCLKHLNRSVRYAITHRALLTIPKLNVSSICIIGFSDAPFANNRDLSIQLGYISLLVDKNCNSVPIILKSYKSRRITRSAMAGEVTAFEDMSDAAVTLSKEVSRLLYRSVALQLLSGSQSLFDVI